MDRHSLQILDTANVPGRCHDLTLYREHNPHLPEHIIKLMDKGYQGLQREVVNLHLPFKATKKRPLEPEHRHYNRLLGAIRVAVEHVIGRLKVFRILAERYRNRRRRFGLRFNLIAGIYNQELLL